MGSKWLSTWYVFTCSPCENGLVLLSRLKQLQHFPFVSPRLTKKVQRSLLSKRLQKWWTAWPMEWSGRCGVEREPGLWGWQRHHFLGSLCQLSDLLELFLSAMRQLLKSCSRPVATFLWQVSCWNRTCHRFLESCWESYASCQQRMLHCNTDV